jgi:hypothetical protein
LFGAYRVFSAPEGIQTEVEVATADPAAVAAAEREVRWRARAHLVKLQEYLARDPNPVVYLQVNFEASPGRWPSVGHGDMAAPPTAPRRSVGELVDDIEDEPGEMAFGQPVAQVRGQQEGLVAVTAQEVVAMGHSTTSHYSHQMR